MPSTGTPASKRAFAGSGASVSYTLFGPPERTMPLYPVRRFFGGFVQGKISEYTPRSRMRRAMSWVYCPPKSRTAILSTASTPRTALAGPPQLLRLLEDLPFRLDGRRDDQLRLLQLADALRADRAHARADG